MGQRPTKITKQWADSPFELIETPRKRRNITNLKTESGAVAAATEMCLVHNIFIRILNCIYLQARNVKTEKDATDFATFIHALIILIHEHHGNEEKYFFPSLEKSIGVEGFMEKNVEQHHAFNSGLEKLETHVNALRAKEEEYDGQKIISLIDGFGTTLTDHLKDEIRTFEDLEQYDSKIDWKGWNKMVKDIAVNTADKDYEIPVLLTNLDNSFEKPYHDSIWPPFPWIAFKIFAWVYIPRHKGTWRFSCCDSYGRPKELQFVD